MRVIDIELPFQTAMCSSYVCVHGQVVHVATAMLVKLHSDESSFKIMSRFLILLGHVVYMYIVLIHGKQCAVMSRTNSHQHAVSLKVN